MMQMLKYGFAAAGIVVPPLAHFKLSDGIEALQENLNLAHKSIGPLVDGTISYIESQKGDDIDGLRVTADRAELNNLEVMEGADLRQLESYLSIRDKGRVLGNLYRVVTTDGNVKWVCIDHYRENYRESVMQHLRDIVAANNGIFTEEKGKIDIKIASGTLAKQFYEAMAKARRIQELDITLQWDVTLDDLRKFAVAVGNANILHLTMDGVNFKGPPLDTINRGRRYDPILQLMSNGRIQSLNLKNFKDFYQRVGSTAFAAAPRLRILSIDAKVSAVEQHSTSTQAKILKTCPRLDELSIESDNFSNMFLVLTSKTSTLQDLKVLTIRWMDSFVTTTLSQGKIRTVVLGISFSSPVFESAWDLIQRGHLTTLTVQDTPKESDNVRMEDILRRNSKLSEIKMVCYGKRAVEITRLITSMREKIISEGGACSLTKVELSDNSWNDDIVKTTVEFSENTIVPKISTSVRMLSYVPRDKSDRLAHLFRERGWSIGDLETDWSFGDNLAAILEESSKGGNSKLTSLALDPRSLTSDGLDSMDKVIERSYSLMNFSLQIQYLNEDSQQEKAQRLLAQHGKVLSSVTLESESTDLWMPKFASVQADAAYPNSTHYDCSALTNRRLRMTVRNGLPPWSQLHHNCHSRRPPHHPLNCHQALCHQTSLQAQPRHGNHCRIFL